MPVSGGGFSNDFAVDELPFAIKGFFQLAQLLIEQIVGLVNQTNENIGYDCGRARFDVGLL